MSRPFVGSTAALLSATIVVGAVAAAQTRPDRPTQSATMGAMPPRKDAQCLYDDEYLTFPIVYDLQDDFNVRFPHNAPLPGPWDPTRRFAVFPHPA